MHAVPRPQAAPVAGSRLAALNEWVAEVAALTAWRKYRLAVSRTSTSPGWPSAVQWPALPT